MPHSTVAYPFEGKVHAWARKLRGGAGFFAAVADDGSLTVQDGDHEYAGNQLVDHDVKARLVASATSWIFYDPFEWPEYAWLEWVNVPRALLERLLGAPFEPADLVPYRDSKPLEAVPGSWDVMF